MTRTSTTRLPREDTANVGRWAGRAALAVILAMAALAIATSVHLRTPAVSIVPALPFYIAGWMILHRVGTHPIGALLCGIGVILQVVTFESLPWLSHLWITWLETWGFSAMFAMFTWLFILFPDGDASGRWRTVGWIASVLVLGGALTPTITDTGDATITLGANPMGLSWLPESTSVFSTMSITGLLVVAAIGVVIRGRRAPREIRPQYAPILATMAALGLFILALLMALLVDPTFTDSDRFGNVLWSVALVVYMLIPASFGVAITRYRLYDIDRVVSRTVTYGLVGAVVAAIYAFPVITLPGLLGESNDLVVAASTLAAAAAFNPVRNHIQRRVDHRFNRFRYDSEREVTAFATRLAGNVDLDLLTEDLALVVDRAISPALCAVWLKEVE